VPFSLTLLGSKYPLVLEKILGVRKTLLAGGDLWVLSKVWNEVVDVITELRLFMLVLGASSRRADGIGFQMDVRIKLKGGVIGIRVVVSSFGNKEYSIIVLHWSPFTVDRLLFGNVTLSILDVLINSKVWHEVISWWSFRCVK